MTCCLCTCVSFLWRRIAEVTERRGLFMVASQITNLPSCRQGSSHRHKTSTRRRVSWLTGQVLTSSGSGQWSHLADSNIQLADNGRAPPFLSEHCIPVSSADTRRHLRSANRHLLAVLRFRFNTYGRRAFSVAGPMAWNSLPDFIRDPTSSTDCFRRLLETRDTSIAHPAHQGFLTIMRYTNPRTDCLKLQNS